MDELAYSLNGENVHYGTPTNPACPDRIPGGSSSGSAVAVADGSVAFALGSDTGGEFKAYVGGYCKDNQRISSVHPQGAYSLSIAMYTYSVAHIGGQLGVSVISYSAHQCTAGPVLAHTGLLTAGAGTSSCEGS